MLKSYVTIALRNLINYPMFAAIKVFGLAVGVAGCVMIFLIARYESSYDKFQTDGDRIYRVYGRFSGLWEGINHGVPRALPGMVKSEFTGLEASAPFETYSTRVIVEDSTGGRNRLETQPDIVFAGPDYFTVFNHYRWLTGSPEALAAPYTVALTEKKAIAYFGSTDPAKVIGRKLTYRDSLDVSVVGIIKNVDEITDFYFTDFISYSTIEVSWVKETMNKSDDWGSTNSSSQFFVKLAKGTDQKKVDGQTAILNKARADHQKKGKDATYVADTKCEFFLQPLADIHFNKEMGIFDNGRSPASRSTLNMLMIVAGLLLLIAAINFINLETAQAIRRAREVGLRKVMGGTRKGLVWHFLTEGFVFTAIAVLLSIPLCYGSIMFFDEFMPQGLSFKISDPLLWAFLAATTLVVTLLSGLYPSLVLSSYQPAVALKNQAAGGRTSRSAYLRRILTVFQFSFSQVLIVGTMIIGMQISFMINKDLGFRTEAIVSFNTPWYAKAGKREALHNELSKMPEVLAINQNTRMPASSGWSTTTMKYHNGKEEVPYNVHIKSGDTTFLSVFNIKLVAGRNVQPVETANEILINETFSEKLGFDPSDALGKQVKASGDKMFTVIGVMKDFNLQSLHHAVEPVFYRFSSNSPVFALKLGMLDGKIANLEQTLAKINTSIKEIYPDNKIEVQFFDDSIAKLYETEKRTAKLAGTATSLAIFISCLGLIGLASFTAVQRTKEIGIRKVLGATVQGIIAMLSRDFLLLVAIAFAIAAPLAWYASGKWLTEYAFHIELSVWIFALAGIASAVIAMITVAALSFRAAAADPVKSLRYE